MCFHAPGGMACILPSIDKGRRVCSCQSMAARPPGQATRSSVRVLSFKRVSLIKCVLRPAGTDDRVLSAPPFVKSLRVPEHLFLQRKDARTEGVRPHRVIRLTVDLHTAVHRVDQAQQLRLGAQRAHRRAEFRLTVVGEDQVLHQHGLLLRHTQAGAVSAASCAPMTRCPSS